MTPPTHNEWLIGTAAAVRQPPHRPRLLPLQQGHALLGGHQQHGAPARAAGGFDPPATLPGTDASIPQTLYIPNLTDMRTADRQRRRHAASGSTYVIAELDGAFTRYKEFTVETEYRTRQGLRPRLVHAQPLLRQLRPGQLDGDDGQRRATSSSARRTSATAPGRQLWDNRLGTLRGDRPHAFKMYGSYFLPWHASVGTYVFAQSGQPWENVELRAVQRVHHVHDRDDQVRRARRVAPRGRHTRRWI